MANGRWVCRSNVIQPLRLDGGMAFARPDPPYRIACTTSVPCAVARAVRRLRAQQALLQEMHRLAAQLIRSTCTAVSGTS